MAKEIKIGDKVCTFVEPLVLHKDKYVTFGLNAKNDENKLSDFLDYQKDLIVELSNGFFKSAEALKKLKISEFSKITKWLEAELMGGDVAKN